MRPSGDSADWETLTSKETLEMIASGSPLATSRMNTAQLKFLLASPESWVCLSHVLHTMSRPKMMIASFEPGVVDYADDKSEETMAALTAALTWVVHSSGLLTRNAARGRFRPDPTDPPCQVEARNHAGFLKSLYEVSTDVSDAALHGAVAYIMDQCLFHADATDVTAFRRHHTYGGRWSTRADEAAEVYSVVLDLLLSSSSSLPVTLVQRFAKKTGVTEFALSKDEADIVVTLHGVWTQRCARTRNPVKLAVAGAAAFENDHSFAAAKANIRRRRPTLGAE